MTLVLRYAARSDRGLVRQSNQDSVYAGPRLLALADGMGGHAAGEVASKVVIAAFVELDDDDPGAELLDQLGEATRTGNAAISELIDSDPGLEGMGTTLTAVLFGGNRLGLVHIGDSRAYLMRDDGLAQITHDDTFVQSLIEEGRITEQEAEQHPQRSLLLKALTGHEIDPTLAVREVRDGDRYLLCSDGLSGVVSHDTLTEAMRIDEPQSCADRLIELALKGGGPDNVTCIVADVVDVDFGEHEPIVAGAAGDGLEDPPPDSSASRASATTLPQTTAAPARIEPRAPQAGRGRLQRRVLAGLVLLALVGGVAVAGVWWVGQQYYVSATDNGSVVIYRGIQGAVLGMSLHTLAESSCPEDASECEEITLSDLTPAVRNEVKSGITTSGLEGARETIDRLRSQQLLPPCPVSDTDTGRGSSSTPIPPSVRSSVAEEPFFATPDASDTASPTPSAVSPAAPSGPQQSPAVGSSVTSEALTSTAPEPEPGVDCRLVK